MLPILRTGDPDSVSAELHHVLQADPFRITPRHWLATILRQHGHVAHAIGHYDRLLPLAVGAGDLFRAIAVQRRLDELDPRPGIDDRFAAIHRWFRMLGVGNLVEASSTHAAGLSARAMILLPGDAFIQAARRSKLEDYVLEPRMIELGGPEQHVVLWGELVWDVKLADGRQRREQRAIEGDLMRADPEFARRGRMRVRPDTPAECLRFEAPLLAQLISVDPNIGGVMQFGNEGIVREERVLLPTRPRRPEDLDRRAGVPAPRPADAPPRLHVAASTPPRPAEPMEEVESWVGYASLTLDSQPLDLSAAGESAAPALDATMVDLDTKPAAVRERPRVEAPGSEEREGGLVVPPTRDPFAAPIESLGAPIERRQGDRRPCEIGGRVRLMGVTGAMRSALECLVFDVSPGGIGVRFRRDDIVAAIAVLEGETLRVELDVPERDAVRVAARMRWIDLGEPDWVRTGLQFVLLAPSDREVIEGLVGAPDTP